MIKILNYFGLFVKEDDVLPYSYTTDEYTPIASENIIMHRDFLKSIEAEENNRLNLLESKTSQIISQTGVTFALLSLFVPIFTDKISDQNFIVKTIFIFILIISYLFYTLTIYSALKNFNVIKFIYSRSSPINVIKYQNSTADDFYAVEVKDLLYSVNLNLKANNQKATNLIYSYNAFRLGNILTALLGVFLCFLLLFSKPEDESVSINTPIKIQHFDSLIQILTKNTREYQENHCIQDSLPRK